MLTHSLSTEASKASRLKIAKRKRKRSASRLESSVDRARSRVEELLREATRKADFYRTLPRCESILREKNPDLAISKEVLWEMDKEEESWSADTKEMVEGVTYEEYRDIFSQKHFDSTELSYMIDRLSAKKEISDIHLLDKDFTRLLARFKEISLRKKKGNGVFPD